MGRLDKSRQKMDKTDRQVKNKARRSQLRCDYILGRRDIVETSKSRQLHRAREMKTFNDLERLHDEVTGMKRNLLGVFIALLLNPVFGGPFAVMAFVSNEMTKTIERLIIMGNLKSARNKFKRVKVISRIYIHDRIVDCYLTLKSESSESCECLSQLRSMKMTSLTVDQQIPQLVYDHCPHLSRQFINNELIAMHDIDRT